MKMLKLSLVSMLLVLSGTTSAYAMGDREQGALIGAGAAILLGGIINAAQQPTRYVETPVYYETRPTVVYREPYVRERVIIIDNPPRRHPHHRYDRYDSYRYYRLFTQRVALYGYPSFCSNAMRLSSLLISFNPHAFAKKSNVLGV